MLYIKLIRLNGENYAKTLTDPTSVYTHIRLSSLSLVPCHFFFLLIFALEYHYTMPDKMDAKAAARIAKARGFNVCDGNLNSILVARLTRIRTLLQNVLI